MSCFGCFRAPKRAQADEEAPRKAAAAEPSFANLTATATLLSAGTDGGAPAVVAAAPDAAAIDAAANERPSSRPFSRGAAPTNAPPHLLQRLGSRGLPDAAAVVAYLGTATASGGGAAPAPCSPSPPPPAAKNSSSSPSPMPPALRGLAAAVAAQPSAADVVAAALDLHALARRAVVNRPNIARMDALGAACVAALDRAGQEQRLGRARSPLPADVCLAVAAVLRDCCALAEGFSREGWLLRLACGGAGLRDEVEMLHGAALELLAGAGLAWAVPSAAQQRHAALALAALAGEGAAAALLAAQEAESGGVGGGAASTMGASSPERQHCGADAAAANNNATNANPPSSWGYVDASRPLRRALRQLGRGRGLAAGVAAAAADPDAADELARLLGVSPAALQAELRAVPSSSAAALAVDGDLVVAAAAEQQTEAPRVASPTRASPTRQQHQQQHEAQQHHHAPLDLDALHGQLLVRRDAATFLRSGGGGGGEGQGAECSPAAAPDAAATTPLPFASADAADDDDDHHEPAAAAPTTTATTTAAPPNRLLLRHPAAHARYASVDPLPTAPLGFVSAAGVRAALAELGLLPTEGGALEAGAAVRRHMALALGGGGGDGASPSPTAAAAMAPETFDRFFEGLLAANPRARIADAAGPAAEAELRRVHAAFAAFGKKTAGGVSSRGGGNSGAGGGTSPAAARPAWSGIMGRSWGGGSSYGGGGAGSSAGGTSAGGGAPPLLDSAQLSKLLRECGLLPPLGARAQQQQSALVRLTAADVDIVYTKCCVASAGGGCGGRVLGAGSGAGGINGGAPLSPMSPKNAGGASPLHHQHQASPFSPSSLSNNGPPRRARGLDFDAFCGALVALSEKSGAPLQAVVGAVCASPGPVATGPSSVYHPSVAGSHYHHQARGAVAAPSTVGGGGGGATRAKAALSVADTTVAGGRRRAAASGMTPPKTAAASTTTGKRAPASAVGSTAAAGAATTSPGWRR